MTEIITVDVVIVGAGVAGVSAAYHIQKTCPDTKLLMLDAGPCAGVGRPPRHSGSATMMTSGRSCIKMMVQIFAGSCDDFTRHHGREGASRYLRATKQGLELQKSIAKEIWKENVDQHMKQHGSYYLACGATNKAHLKREFQLFTTLKGDCFEGIEWCDQERLKEVPGIPKHYDAGIYFPNDAIIDSSLYAKTLLQHILSNINVQFWPHSTLKTYGEENDKTVRLVLTNGKEIRAKQVVVATGAFFQDPNLHGILKPCYSYLVNVPISIDNPSHCQESSNFFTWGFSHDWCFANGAVRISGEDHFSAYKPPHLLERSDRLSKWALQQYEIDIQNIGCDSFPQQYGLYGETPDMVPLIGKLHKDSRVCYLTGCNAWGQTILSYCASLVPGMLELTDLTKEQQDILKLVQIQRFSKLPAVDSSAIL
jgi:glycine/D-amino acid oxidase-like deaminating enzyme